MMAKKIYRSNDKVLCGVCGGISDYFDLDASIVRVGWVLISCFTALIPGIIAYIICAAILPTNPNDDRDSDISNMKSAGSSSSQSNSKASGDFDSYFK
ncbi:MAG: PspC domain-containing protein [Treponema sp.]|nr:PspC domain-containing protein [Treponema sp.]MBR4004233.1 PspC domain-containing protein [Treponema sp.]